MIELKGRDGRSLWVAEESADGWRARGYRDAAPVKAKQETAKKAAPRKRSTKKN